MSWLKRLRKKKQPDTADLAQADSALAIPCHLGVIMDGNGRWAKKRRLPRQAGHRVGAENLKTLCKLCGERGIQYLTVYAFSTENWQRPTDEVQALMQLFVEFFLKYEAEIIAEGIRIRFAGERAGLGPEVIEVIEQAEADSRHCEKMQLIIALNYGGRTELVSAVRRIIDAKLPAAQIDEATIRQHLYLPDVPDPDLIIRPSGEQRLSNFLLWQAAYAEFWYDTVLWPDFGAADLDRALLAYGQRQRRFGGLES